MRTSSITRCFLLLCALVVLRSVAGAATLQAKVVAVQSGNTLVVSNINRTLKVRLKGIAPPEAGQPFADAAREHLKMLVMDKPVMVDYSDLSDGYLQAKISLDGIDIGSQMLRDGVAWYDRNVNYGLSDTDRNLYAQCEEAARNEKRGLWSNQNPVAPWEYRRAQQEKLAGIERPSDAPRSFSSLRQSSRRSAASFSNGDLLGMNGLVGPGSIAGTPSFNAVAPNSLPGEWVRFQSADNRFSIRIPGNSYHYEFPVLDSAHEIVNVNYVVGAEDGSLYLVMWTKGANNGMTTASAAAETIKGFVEGMNRNLEQTGQTLRVTTSAGRDVKFGEYAGRQYALTLGPLSAAVRVLSKQVGEQREVFMIGSFAGTGGEPSIQFLNSLKFVVEKQRKTIAEDPDSPN